MRIPISQLNLLTARVEWLQRVVGCIGAFEHCYWGTDVDRVLKALQEAVASKPKKL